MVYRLSDTEKAGHLFAGCRDTLVLSCLERVMGEIYVTDQADPASAFAYLGCFGFFAGEPDLELVSYRPSAFSILIPPDQKWASLIEDVYPDAGKVTRYAIRKDTVFDTDRLRKNLMMLPDGYELRPIEGDLYEMCLKDPVTEDFVSSFQNKDAYLELGRGFAILKNGRIVSGASSYSRYRGGIEIEVDTVASERRKHLALVSCSALILRCLEEGLDPSWDAQNPVSVLLAEKLGYKFDHEYTAYEVC